MIFINIRRAQPWKKKKGEQEGGGEKEHFWTRRDTAVSSNRMRVAATGERVGSGQLERRYPMWAYTKSRKEVVGGL